VAPYPAPQVVAVRAGRLFDPRSGTMLTNQVIVIRGDRIVDVGANAAIPAGARTVDLSRVTVLPGLIDTHLHVMDGNPLIAPGGPGVGPSGPGPVGLNQPLQYRELEALVNANSAISTPDSRPSSTSCRTAAGTARPNSATQSTPASSRARECRSPDRAS
jgi:hypothetical protein